MGGARGGIKGGVNEDFCKNTSHTKIINVLINNYNRVLRVLRPNFIHKCNFEEIFIR